jgi:hypothetical protein
MGRGKKYQPEQVVRQLRYLQSLLQKGGDGPYPTSDLDSEGGQDDWRFWPK